MRRIVIVVILLLGACSTGEEGMIINGLNAPVELVVDEYGITHIYAENEEDLFFAQGFNAARDRLFQLEIWRRQASGTVAEIVGERALNRDIGTRLFKFRGDMQQEMAHYHENGVAIIESFTKGVNAYIAQTELNPDLLPPEFAILGIRPQAWTPDIVISRHQGLLGNIGQELAIGRAVAAAGEDAVRQSIYFEPDNPNLTLDPSITLEMLEKDILGLYNAYRQKVTFDADDKALALSNFDDPESIGSNNWIVSGEKTQSGSPIMANDPHRTQAIPSLRYWVHLNAPGWDVIGGGEPEIPGVSIGHNGVGAWGLTVFRTDAEDLMVYDLNPDNLEQYSYQGAWESMIKIVETIEIKDRDPETVTLRYTRHGPVTFIDSVLHKGYAVRCGWLEVGGSPYLASLRMDQAQTWEDFREACSFSNIPGENMIWADKDGTIGWQAVGIAPVREHWSGLVPVPGDGSHEWNGYLPIKQKPNLVNPSAGFFATANQYVVPDGYPHMNAVGYVWSDDYRGDRINAVLSEDKKFSMDDMIALQTDYYSIPAQTWVAYLNTYAFTDPTLEDARQQLLNWNYKLSPDSRKAGLYVAWERALQDDLKDRIIPVEARGYINYVSMSRMLEWFEQQPQTLQEAIVTSTFTTAINTVSSLMAEDETYGGANFKHISLEHALDALLDKEQKSQFNTEVLPRGGNSFTLNNTSGNNKQTHGASFRIIVDTGDFTRALGMNSPGQSGDPRSMHYKDLYELWASDQFFPVYFLRKDVMAHQDQVIHLRPH